MQGFGGHVSNPSTQEVDAGWLGVQVHPWLYRKFRPTWDIWAPVSKQTNNNLPLPAAVHPPGPWTTVDLCILTYPLINPSPAPGYNSLPLSFLMSSFLYSFHPWAYYIQSLWMNVLRKVMYELVKFALMLQIKWVLYCFAFWDRVCYLPEPPPSRTGVGLACKPRGFAWFLPPQHWT